jgi:PIN domain nuclease of toxin-antitoxin system
VPKRFLLDTHIFLWFYQANKRLPERLRRSICDVRNDIAVSIVSFWEIAIKVQTGKLELLLPLEDLMNKAAADNMTVLPVQPSHILTLTQLPMYHIAPFDRMIIAQGIADKLTIVSKDEHFGKYPADTAWEE